MTSALLINVVELLRSPGTTKDVDVSVECEAIAFDDARLVDEPVGVQVRLESMSTGITVAGRVSATWAGECRRCLAPVRERLRVDVDELYQRVLEDPDAHPIVNDQINLVPMVRENLLVALPVGPLCRSDCPGICPQCGADLAVGACGCTVPNRDPRWAVLDALRSTDDD